MPGETYDAANLHRCSRPGRTAWSALQHRSDLGSPWQASPHPRRPRPLHVQPEHGPGNAPSKVPGRPACGRRQGWCPMTPAPRRKPAVDGPGPVRLADAIDPPEDPRPETKRGPTLPAGFGRQPEARPQGDFPRGRTLPASIEPMLHIDDLAALLSCSRRLVERMRAGGRIPRPDLRV